MALNAAQREQLLKPLNANRVAKRTGGGGKTLSYLEAWDVKAHLTRIFGFGGWSFDVIETCLAYEQGEGTRWDAGYKVVGRLTVYGIGPTEQDVTYTEAAVGTAIGNRSDAHDNAIKTGESDALKRCATSLGTQFGLSLYDDGATRDVVMKTLDQPDTASA